MRTRKMLDSVGVALAVFSCLLSVGCGGSGSVEGETSSAISRNRRLWESRDIPSYRYTLRVNAFVAEDARGPVVIEVRDGVPISVRFLSGERAVSPERFESCDTMDELFDKLESAAENNAVRQEQTFDSDFGYPVSAYIDYELRVVDEEYGFTVSDFSPIPSVQPTIL